MGVYHPYIIAPPHLQSLPYCNTIARPLRNTHTPTNSLLVCHTPYNIDDGNIVLPRQNRAQWACRGAPDPSAPRAASDFDPTSHAGFGAATHPGVGAGTHRRRATVERC